MQTVSQISAQDPTNSKSEEKLIAALHSLAEVTPNSSPLISCFVNLDSTRANAIKDLERQATEVSKRLPGKRRNDFDDAFDEIREHLVKELSRSARSVAIYCRWGTQPFFNAIEFQVPLETKLIVDSHPHIYPIIETKDTYHRFAIVIVTETEARIVETLVGAITREIFAKRPELRERLGREWTREHYQNHKRDRNKRFLQTKVRIVDDIMQQRGHNHLVVAGSPKMVSRFTDALPDRLRAKILTTLYANPSNGIYPIVQQSIELFAANEHVESHDRVAELENAILSTGLGVAGVEATREALLNGYADMLIIDADFEIPSVREDLVRLATRAGVEIETVRQSQSLARLSGVGCLLRYRPNPADATDETLVA
ncbi:MAG: hypothetical protein AAGC74_14085 [Verrucomicrobiota bacterium]